MVRGPLNFKEGTSLSHIISEETNDMAEPVVYSPVMNLLLCTSLLYKSTYSLFMGDSTSCETNPSKLIVSLGGKKWLYPKLSLVSNLELINNSYQY